MFIIIAILGSVFETPKIVGVLNGLSYYGIPFSYWSKDFLSSPYTYDFHLLPFLINILSWGLVSLLLSKIVLRIRKGK